MADFKHGKINLSRLRSTQIKEIDGVRCITIPIDENHLIENFKHDIYMDLVSFETDKLKPYSHTIHLSVAEEFRKNVSKDFWLLGGYKLK